MTMHTPGVRHLMQRGFTLIELIVVMTVISLLLTLAAPRYFKSIERSKETVLKANLTSTRDALDKYHSDTWVLEAPADGQPGAVYNIRSSAEGAGSNGVPYAQW